MFESEISRKSRLSDEERGGGLQHVSIGGRGGEGATFMFVITLIDMIQWAYNDIHANMVANGTNGQFA